MIPTAPVVKRIQGLNIVLCPHCNELHQHGASSGIRVNAHCRHVSQTKANQARNDQIDKNISTGYVITS